MKAAGEVEAPGGLQEGSTAADRRRAAIREAVAALLAAKSSGHDALARRRARTVQAKLDAHLDALRRALP